jgi:hypothetical protein
VLKITKAPLSFATPVAGAVNPRIDGEAGAGEDKGPSRPLDCLTA